MTDRFRGNNTTQDTSDEKDGSDREARVAYVLARALSLSDELKTTVEDLSEMLQSANETEAVDHDE